MCVHLSVCVCLSAHVHVYLILCFCLYVFELSLVNSASPPCGTFTHNFYGRHCVLLPSNRGGYICEGFVGVCVCVYSEDEGCDGVRSRTLYKLWI